MTAPGSLLQVTPNWADFSHDHGSTKLEEEEWGVAPNTLGLFSLHACDPADKGLHASPAADLSLAATLGSDRGLGVAPVTEGELPWGVRLLLLLNRDPLLARLLRLCSPADAPGLDTAPVMLQHLINLGTMQVPVVY